MGKNGAKKFQHYLARSQKLYEVSLNHFLYQPFEHWWNFLRWSVLRHVWQIPFFQSLKSQLGKTFQSEELKKILSYTVAFLGGSPANTPALYSLMAHVDFNLGVWYPMGGLYEVSKALEKIAKEKGATFFYHSPVGKILVEAGKAVGVQVGKKKYLADVVISNADYPFTQLKLLHSENRTYRQSYWQKKILAPSAFLIYLGIKKKLPKLTHHNLFLGSNWEEHFKQIFDTPAWPSDPAYYISCPSKTDPSVVPAGKENVFILVPVASGLADSDQLREKYASKILRHLEQLIGAPFIKDIEVQRIFTQRDFEERYNAYAGTALGLAHTLTQTALFRPHLTDQKVKGLFYVGQYTQPGIGLPMCLISAQLLLKKLTS